MVAKFSKFYSMSLSEVLAMPLDEFSNFYTYIPIIESQERLINYDVSAYPHLKEQTRKENYNKVFKSAYPDELDTREVLTTEQAFIKLTRGF
jgi:hypothetical protein